MRIELHLAQLIRRANVSARTQSHVSVASATVIMGQ
jgi:hypothetical protein